MRTEDAGVGAGSMWGCFVQENLKTGTNWMGVGTETWSLGLVSNPQALQDRTCLQLVTPESRHVQMCSVS